MTAIDPIIEAEGLSFSYPDGRPVLKDARLVVRRGESVALIGPNGAGKSTLLLHFNGLLRGEGKLRVFGLPVEGKNLRQIRLKAGLVFQEPDDQLFSPTVYDDVAFGPANMALSHEEVRRRVTAALHSVAMSGFEKRSPHHLSVGEKRRIAMATVLSMSPDLLLLDEPTAGLDPAGKWELIDLLKGLPVTKIIASHDLEMVEAVCPRTVILDGGAVVADGPTSLLLSDRALLYAHRLAAAPSR